MIIEQIFILAVVLNQAESREESVYQPSTAAYWKFESTETMSKAARAVVKKVLSVEQAEGVGARVRRSVGRQEVRVVYVYTLDWGIPRRVLSQLHLLSTVLVNVCMLIIIYS